MEYTVKNFAEEVADKVSEMMGEDFHVEINPVDKNNGIVLQGLNIRKAGVNICPCIYLDRYFEEYKRGGMGLHEIAEDVIAVYKENDGACDFDITRFTNFANARTNLRCRLVNTERNSKLLSESPHREYLDLSLLYFVEYPDCQNGLASIRVMNHHMKSWGVSEDELYQIAMENMKKADDGLFVNMAQMMAYTMDIEPCAELEDCNCFMYVLTNERKLNGAVQILNDNMMKRVADKIGRDFAIIPSSLHEVLIIPMSSRREEEEFYTELKDMVKQVNDTAVSDTEILSYSVYRYDGESGEIEIAA